MCNEKWILYDNWQPSAQWLGRVEAPQHFPKPILYPKTVMVTGSLLPVWSTTAFWIPVKRSHLRNMLSRLMWCTENCNTCSWSTRRTRFFCVTVLNHTPHDQHFKSWTNWATKFCPLRHIHPTSCQPTTILHASQQFFAGKTLPQPGGGRKCFPRVHWIPKHGFLCYGNKPIYFSLAKMCWL